MNARSVATPIGATVYSSMLHQVESWPTSCHHRYSMTQEAKKRAQNRSTRTTMTSVISRLRGERPSICLTGKYFSRYCTFDGGSLSTPNDGATDYGCHGTTAKCSSVEW